MRAPGLGRDDSDGIGLPGSARAVRRPSWSAEMARPPCLRSLRRLRRWGSPAWGRCSRFVHRKKCGLPPEIAVTTDLSLPSEPLLVAAQQAAMARLRDAICRGGVAVLCGPAGSGKTMLLTRLASEQAAVTGRPSGPYPLRQLVDNPDNGPQRVALIDDAHAAVDAAQLRRVVDSIERLTTSTAVVLAGEGRLLTLLMRQPDLEQRVRLRAVLPAWSESESVSLITSALPAMMARAEGPRLASRMHELAAGIPRQLVRLIDTVGMVLAAEPGHDLSVDDLETFHRRLFLQAA